MSGNSYIKGAGILAIGGLLSRFIGLFYKAAITKVLGSYAIGLYYNTFFILNFFLSFIISAVPLTLSKMISEKNALGDRKSVHKILWVTTILLTFLGTSFTFIIIKFGRQIISIAGWDANTYYPLMGLSFAPMLIMYVCIIRGYFQGMNNMKPTAVSQIAESIARLAVGVPLCLYLTKKYSQLLGAGGATFGVSVSEAVGLIVIFTYFVRLYDGRIKNIKNYSTDGVRSILKRFLSIAIPVSITSLLLSLSGMINSFTYGPRLKIAGIDLQEATRMFGDYSNASTLINIPMTISMAVSTAILPSIAESFIRGDYRSIVRKTSSAIRIIFIVGLPCIVGLSLFSNQIFRLIFNESSYGGPLLKYGCLSIISIMLAGTMQSILQGMDIFKKVINNILISMMVKYLLNYILMAIPELNIYGMILSNFASYTLMAILNYYVLKREVGIKLNIYENILKPLFSSAILATFLYLLSPVVFLKIREALGLIIIILVAIPFYLAVLLVTNTLKEEDLSLIPGLERLKKYYSYFK